MKGAKLAAVLSFNLAVVGALLEGRRCAHQVELSVAHMRSVIHCWTSKAALRRLLDNVKAEAARASGATGCCHSGT